MTTTPSTQRFTTGSFLPLETCDVTSSIKRDSIITTTPLTSCNSSIHSSCSSDTGSRSSQVYHENNDNDLTRDHTTSHPEKYHQEKEDDHNDNDIDDAHHLDGQIEQMRQELIQLRQHGRQLRETIHPHELQACREACDRVVATLTHRLKRQTQIALSSPHQLLCRTILQQVHTNSTTTNCGGDDKTTVLSAMALPPPYVLKQQVQLMQAMHATFLIHAKQNFLIQKQQQDMTAYLEDEKSTLQLEMKQVQERQLVQLSQLAEQNNTLYDEYLATIHQQQDELKQLRNTVGEIEHEDQQRQQHHHWKEETTETRSIANTSSHSSSHSNTSSCIRRNGEDDTEHTETSSTDEQDDSLHSSWRSSITESWCKFLDDVHPEKLAQKGKQVHESFVAGGKRDTSVAKGSANHAKSTLPPSPPVTTTTTTKSDPILTRC
jgi:hypothetical protein